MGIGEVRSVKMFFVAPDIVSDISNDLIQMVGDDTIWW